MTSIIASVRPMAAEFSKSAVRLLMLIGILLLSACKAELYAQLSESDANDMLTVLRRSGLEAEKVLADGGKAWSLRVADDQVVRAMTVLRENGLPRTPHVSLGDLFKKDSMVSSPTEDRVRFLHGVSQELSETLSRIDGVVHARVHIVLPDNDPRVRNAAPSSASVFIKHHPLVNLDTLIPAIRQLVARSIEGLDGEHVSVTLVPAQVFAEAPGHEADVSMVWTLLIGLLAAGMASAMTWFWHRRRAHEGTSLSWPVLAAQTTSTGGTSKA